MRPRRADEGDGDPVQVTLLERVVETLSVGGYIEDAAARCGISPTTFRNWQREGTVAQADMLRGRKRLSDMTYSERRALRFCAAVDKAEADGKVVLLSMTERLARGGIPMGKTVEKVDAQGNLLERTTTTEFSLPDMRAIQFRLARRHGMIERHGLEVTGRDGGPIEVQSPIDKLDAYLARVREAHAHRDRLLAAVDAPSAELPAAGDTTNGDTGIT